jgi:O-antigen/teichoic acid export membrane protein
LTSSATEVASIRKRVLAGVGANATGQLVNIIMQIASLPLFLRHWSVAEYGRWLLLSAIPGYFALADVGIGTVAMNKITMLAGNATAARSVEVFQTAIAATLILVVCVFLVSSCALWIAPAGELLTNGGRAVLICLIATALLNVFGGLFDAVFRAGNCYAQGTYILSAARLLEWLGGVGALLSGGSMLAVAAAMLCVRLGVTIALVPYTAYRFPSYGWGVAAASRQELRELLAPAISFLAFPIGSSLNIQGISILVGTRFGPTALVLFNTYRTISRLLVQLLATITRSLWPEISRAFGQGDRHLLQRIYRRGTRLAIYACGLAACGLYLVGGLLVSALAHDQLPYDRWLFALFLLLALANCLWQVAMVVLQATNRHVRLSLSYLLASAVTLLVVLLLPRAYGIYGILLALGAFEVTMLLASRTMVANFLARHATL